MPNNYPKYKICVSGAAETGHCGEEAMKMAEELGGEIARHQAVLVDGATTGFPLWAAKGAKGAGGIVVGVSPAATKREHLEEYKLPVDYHDIVFYSGAGYSGRNLLLTKLADGVIVGCGRMGTINEFTIAFEDKKPLGILEGEWETDEVVKFIIKESHRAQEMKDKIVYSENPQELLDLLMEVIKREEAKNHHL